MNGISTLVLFDLRATRPFESLDHSKRFVDAPGELDCRLEVDTADDCPVRVSRVHQGCVLELFSERNPINLVVIPLDESKVILEMDW